MIFNEIKQLQEEVENLTRRIERLEYIEPKNIDELYEKYKYTKYKDIYYLDKEYICRELMKEDFYIREGFSGVSIKDAFNFSNILFPDVENLKYFGEIYEWCKERKELRKIKEEKERKKNDKIK